MTSKCNTYSVFAGKYAEETRLGRETQYFIAFGFDIKDKVQEIICLQIKVNMTLF